jgi:NADH-quinone oxidoreductase subunit G
MPTLTIDGQEVTVEQGTSIIQAAEKLGIFIPRYCFHPGLSVAGSCRMCLVEVENLPNLQISCYILAQDGMKVVTDSPRVQAARRAMLELLLSNHPLDCPVCDQSGECDLQNFYMEHGRYQSRFLENKIKRKKAFPIGTHVMLDQERCILCTRCVRFTEEVSRSNELGVFNRGNHSTIELYPDQTLDNLYSGNVIDICPVGALTEREFRFQCRVWYLQTEESICNGCARGCNINFHFNTSRTYKAGGKRVFRVKPRYNPDVNQWWICDLGRFGYPFIDENRIEYPCLRGAKELEPTSWESAIDQAASVIQNSLESHGGDSVGVIVSPQLSNEELLVAHRLFVEELQLTNVALQNPWQEPGQEDGFLLKSDRNPNTRGAQAIGFQGDARSLLEKVSSGKIRVLYICWHSFDNDEAQKLLGSAECIIFQGVNWNQTAEIATVVLPDATHAEKDGTFTNFEGRIQRFKQALLPLEEARPGTEILSLLAERLGHPVSTLSPEEAFLEWQGMPYDELGDFGVVVKSESAVQT